MVFEPLRNITVYIICEFGLASNFFWAFNGLEYRLIRSAILVKLITISRAFKPFTIDYSGQITSSFSYLNGGGC
jgi:hypothetical protein